LRISGDRAAGVEEAMTNSHCYVCGKLGRSSPVAGICSSCFQKGSTKECKCAKPIVPDPNKPGTSRPYPMPNRWPECRVCGRVVKREIETVMLNRPIPAGAKVH